MRGRLFFFFLVSVFSLFASAELLLESRTDLAAIQAPQTCRFTLSMVQQPVKPAPKSVSKPKPEPKKSIKEKPRPRPKAKPVPKPLPKKDKKKPELPPKKEQPKTKPKAEPAPPKAPQQASTAPQSVLDAYVRALYAAIEEEKDYPRRALRFGIEGDVTIRFVIDSSGNLQKAELIRKSPSRILDKSALESLRNARLPAPPETIPLREFTITINYTIGG